MARGTDPETLRRLAREIQKKQDITKSLSAASQRQRYMLPKKLVVPGYEVASIYLPCSDVSGDYYDMLELDPEHTAFFMGDVAGHGIEAAIVMGMARKTMSIYARQYRKPVEVLARSNDELAGDLDSETFVTSIYCLLELPSGRLTMVRAGHPRPVLFNPERSPKWSYIDARGLVMGMTHGDTYRKSIAEAEILLSPGDLLFFYTDGLVEARDRRNETFGQDRMLEVMERHGARGPKSVIRGMVRKVEEFLDGQEAQDDITLIAVRRASG
jgi:serine phosphatase RsbU (regulator of sigma subunit)